MLEKEKYDHVVINDDLERAVEKVRELAGLSPSEHAREEAP